MMASVSTHEIVVGSLFHLQLRKKELRPITDLAICI